MKIKHIIPHLFLLLSTVIGTEVMAQTAHPVDTLQRELTLQRDYVPVGHQAQKATFNPLDTKGKSSLKAIEFARNTYQVGVNVTPKLLPPINNPLAPDYPSQTLHARFFGGYPIYAGANIGVATNLGKKGSILIGLDHLSRVNKTKAFATPFKPLNTTHDTELRFNYSQALNERVLNVGLEGYHHLHSYYGHALRIPNSGLNDKLNGTENFQEHYRLFRLSGGEATLSLSPAPLSMLSGWQYSVIGKIGFTKKEEPFLIDGSTPILTYGEKAGITNGENDVTELNIRLDGNLGYVFAGTDWGFGMDGTYQLLSLSKLKAIEGLDTPYLISIDPYIEYNSPSFKVKAGAKVQLMNRGNKNPLIAPDVELRWKATPLFTLYSVIDGGTEYNSLREFYHINRYAEAGSVYTAYDITKYRALLGLRIGNLNGLSLDFYGGYADLYALSDWSLNFHEAPLHPSISQDPFNVVTFRKSNKGPGSHFFLSAKADYVSNIGLNLAAGIKYNKYRIKSSSTEEKVASVTGLPSVEINIKADYLFNDRLSATVALNGMGGIRFYDYSTSPIGTPAYEVKAPFIHELDACISYKIHENIGLSLIGKNIFNNKNTRWAFYERPGAAIIGAITISL